MDTSLGLSKVLGRFALEQSDCLTITCCFSIKWCRDTCFNYVPCCCVASNTELVQSSLEKLVGVFRRLASHVGYEDSSEVVRLPTSQGQAHSFSAVQQCWERAGLTLQLGMDMSNLQGKADQIQSMQENLTKARLKPGESARGGPQP